MTRTQTNAWGQVVGAGAIAMLVLLVCTDAQAYPFYDDAQLVPQGCVSCHDQFKGGNTGVLHFTHLNQLGITQCNFCHPNGGGSTPVRTYISGPGGGFGCAGCHGQDYGEMNGYDMVPAPKSSGYGLRLVHAAAGVTECAGCHGPNPFPVLGENVKPPYYLMPGSSLKNPCDSDQEDLVWSGDLDVLGLDNDGNGFRDWPADLNCAEPTTTTSTTSTTTTTLPVECAVAPAGGCIAAGKAVLNVNEKSAGKEKLKLSLTKLVPAVTQGQFGDPVGGSTSYVACIYNALNALVGEYGVARGGDTCDGDPCWEDFKTTGYKYQDKLLAADGIQKMQLNGGDAGKGQVKVSGKNNASASNLPTGVAAALNGATQATAQVVTSDGQCFGMTLNVLKTADGLVFSASAP